MILTLLFITGCGENDNPYEGLDYSKYMKLGEYKGIEIKEINVSVDKSDVETAIKEELAKATENIPVEKGKKVKNGDTVNIDYAASIDGKESKKWSAKDKNLELGKNTFISGFEEGLVGHIVGEKGIKLELVFPKDYKKKKLQGKNVVFKVRINSAIRPVEPEYGMEFIKSQGEYASEEAYEKAIEKKLYKERKEKAVANQKNDILIQVMDNTEVKKYPKEIVQHYISVYDEQIDYFAEQYNTTRKAVVRDYYGINKKSVLKKQLKESARVLVKREMIIEYIAQKEQISNSDEKLEEMKAILEEQGYNSETIERETGKSIEQYVRMQLLSEKVLDFLMDNAIVKR